MAGERKFIEDNVKRALLREYLKEQVKRAGYGGADIQRTPMGTRVTLITERPGLVIGRKGSSIKAITNAIEFDFGFDKPQVEVVEVENANLSAQIMAEKLASALERGWHFRRAGHSTVRRIMDNGAKGCQVIISGKLTGQRHRTEKFKEGHIKFCGEPKLQWMEEGYTPAKLKAGVIGVKVQIMHPKARLPDEVNILDDKPPEPKSAPSKKLASEKSGAEGSDAKKEKVEDKKGKEKPAPEPAKKDKKKGAKKGKAPKEEKPVEKPIEEVSIEKNSVEEASIEKNSVEEVSTDKKPVEEKVASAEPAPVVKEGTENGTA